MLGAFIQSSNGSRSSKVRPLIGRPSKLLPNLTIFLGKKKLGSKCSSLALPFWLHSEIDWPKRVTLTECTAKYIKTHFRYISSPRAWRSDDHHVCCLFFPHWLCRNVWKTRKLSWQWNLIQKPVSTNITWFAWIRRIRLTESKRDQVEIDIYLLLRK